MGPEPGDGALSEQLLGQQVQGALQVGHGDVLVDDHPLHLVEHGGVGGVHLVLAVDPTGGDDADGQGHGVHGPHLHGGGLGAEHHPAVLIEVEGIAPVPGGVALLGVEPVEIQLGQLHLGAVQNGEAHAHKDVLNLVQGDIHGVLVALLDGLAGDGDVDGLGLQPLLQGGGGQLLGGELNGLLQDRPDLVGQGSHGGPLLGGQLAHLLQNGGELPLFAQILHPQLVQGGGVRSASDGLQRLAFDFR